MSLAQTQSIEVASIRMDGGTQARAYIDEPTVDAYAQAMDEGTAFPAITVYYDGTQYWLADGFHRLTAIKRRAIKHAACTVNSGTLEDAILHAAGANKLHGLRRTNADKRRAVEMLLACEKWAGKSDRWIAEQTGVSHTTVQNMRGSTGKDCQLEKRTGQDGKTRKMPERQDEPVIACRTDPDQAADSVIDASESLHAEGWTPRARHALAVLSKLDDTEKTAIRDEAVKILGARP